MSERNYSLTGLNQFLDYALEKGLMKKETAAGRKRAANQVLGILDDHELQDLRMVDLEASASRFAILQGSNFKPSSLQVYVSRTKSAAQDFISYVDDPINFKSSVNVRANPTNGNSKKTKKKNKKIALLLLLLRINRLIVSTTGTAKTYIHKRPEHLYFRFRYART